MKERGIHVKLYGMFKYQTIRSLAEKCSSMDDDLNANKR